MKRPQNGPYKRKSYKFKKPLARARNVFMRNTFLTSLHPLPLAQILKKAKIEAR